MDGGMDGGVPPPPGGACWTGPFTMYFNPNLDAPFDRALGWNAGARTNAFQAAAGQWNAALAALGSTVRINVTDTTVMMPPAGGDFAADWSGFYCVDNTTDAPRLWNVYSRDFMNPHGHSGNGTNTGSFGHPVAAVGPVTNGPGWTGIVRVGGGSYGSAENDALGETQTLLNMAGKIREADIVFHTHLVANMNCTLIPWASPVVAGSYDFQSVALHELGHALGLGHIPADGNNPGNVMRPTIMTGQVLAINAVERAALAALYGAGGPCPPPPPPPPGP